MIKLKNIMSTKKNVNKGQIKSKILVVDDERSTVNVLKMALESDNYRVVEAFTGEGAILKARKEVPDLILLDLMLPDMTGYEICNTIKKDPLTRSIPIIMLTGIGEGGRIAGMELGANDFITKPFNLNELKSKIRHVLQNPIV